MKRIITGVSLCLLGAASFAGPGMPAATATDSMAQRTAACVVCHGAQGRATGEGYFPRIAGKPEGYLYNQLINFRQQRRVNPAMTHMVANLSDDYLREMAAYFAAQHPPYPQPQRTAMSQRQLEQGKNLVLHGDLAKKVPACVSCHGATLGGVLPAIPGLLGLSRDYLNMQFGAWRNGVRRGTPPDCMSAIANRLGADDVAAVAAWLSAQPVPPAYTSSLTLPTPLPAQCGGVQ